MNVYVCCYKTDEEPMYVGEEKPAWAKEYYAHEMDCDYIDVRYCTILKNVECGKGFLTVEECGRLGLMVREE